MKSFMAQWEYYNALEVTAPAEVEAFLIEFLASRGLDFAPGTDWSAESERLAKSIFLRDQDCARAISMSQIYMETGSVPRLEVWTIG